MRPGYDLVREQVFFRRELRERVLWVIKIRWVFVGVSLAGLLVAALMGFHRSAGPLAAVCAGVLVYNTAFVFVARRIETGEPAATRPISAFAHIQIACDLAALFVAICLSGGLSSPFLVFVLFHVILAGLLLPPTSTFLYAGAALLLTAAVALAQHLPAWRFSGLVSLAGASEMRVGGDNPLFTLVAFAMAIVFSAFLTASMRKSLRSKGRSLLAISKDLDLSNTRLLALYEMVKEIGRQSSLKELLDTATSQAARLMGVKACSIKLLDEQKKYLEFASTHGLSEDYLSKGKLELDKSPINRDIIEGKSHVIGRIDEKDYFQYPEDIEREGISSMLCLPLRGNSRTLGVFCLYSRRHYLFDQQDVEFAGLMCDLTGIAIERVKWDLTKSWFMAKVTHNLRAPLGAVSGMLSVVLKGYLGEVNEKQKETLERCGVRLGILAELVGDLLRVGRERTEGARSPLHPVDAGKVLKGVEALFTDQATRKGIRMEFEVDEAGLEVMAGEGLLEDLFTNLVSNAVKYTPAGGRVQVLLARDVSDRVRFEVSDTGIGIPEADMPGLFSEFFRAENARGVSEEGTGLGLVIVKEILDRLGGDVRVESRPGEGTRMICGIPGLPTA